MRKNPTVVRLSQPYSHPLTMSNVCKVSVNQAKSSGCVALKIPIIVLRHESRNKGIKHSCKKKSRIRGIWTRSARTKIQCSNYWAKESTAWRSCQRLNIYLQPMRNLPRQISKVHVWVMGRNNRELQRTFEPENNENKHLARFSSLDVSNRE